MFLTKKSNLIVDGLLALLYPQGCAVCQRSVESRYFGTVCAGCWATACLFPEQKTICWKCGSPSLATIAPDKAETVRCGRCDDDAFNNARACGEYEGALRATVLGLKREPTVSGRLSDLLVDLQGRPPLDHATLIIPVPLHPQREKARGFNQAAVLGKELSRQVSLPFAAKTLRRITHSERHRAGMDATARQASVSKAFEVSNPRLVAGEHVLLVDDVFTTGATVSACAGSLLEAGAESVLVLTIARAVR